MKNARLFLAALSFFVTIIATTLPAHADPKFTECKFFSTKGEFDWDKVVYGSEFDKSELCELQVLIEFENPTAKPFDVTVKGYLNGKLYKTEPYKNLKESGGFNSGFGGDSGKPGTVAPGLYKAEVWYGGKAVMTAEAVVQGPVKNTWRLTVDSRDDIGETDAAFKTELKEAFEAMGDTVVDEPTDGAIGLHFTLGKDDADDDNDGKPDGKEAEDSDGDNALTNHDYVDPINLDNEIPDVMDGYPDKDKTAGIYIYLEKETGLSMLFLSKVDSLAQPRTAKTNSQRGFFRNIAFSFKPVAAEAAKTVATEVAQTVDEKSKGKYMIVLVNNLGPSVNEEDLRQHFLSNAPADLPKPEILSCKVVIDKIIKRPAGYGFVEFTHPDPLAVIKALEGSTLGPKKISLSEATPQASGAGKKPRSAYDAQK